MSNWTDMTFYQWQNSVINHDLIEPFALTDALILRSSRQNIQQLHFWQTPPSFILGMMDTRLPYFEEAIEGIINESSHQIIVRNSGGLGIISDPGILNISLFFPQNSSRIPIDEGYERMVTLIQALVHQLRPQTDIEVGEIAVSYCPGDYDLSIQGQKFAGIAQRRLQNGLAIMIYLSVTGDQLKRSEHMKTFYEKGIQEQATKWDYPNISPESMTTLADALQLPDLTVQEVKRMIEEILITARGSTNESFEEDYQKAYQKMIKRNSKFLPGFLD